MEKEIHSKLSSTSPVGKVQKGKKRTKKVLLILLGLYLSLIFFSTVHYLLYRVTYNVGVDLVDTSYSEWVPVRSIRVYTEYRFLHGNETKYEIIFEESNELHPIKLSQNEVYLDPTEEPPVIRRTKNTYHFNRVTLQREPNGWEWWLKIFTPVEKVKDYIVLTSNSYTLRGLYKDFINPGK